MSRPLSYAAITPARDEATNLRRLADCLTVQSVKPTAWIVVDNGSTDETLELARTLAEEHPWIRAIRVPGSGQAAPGAPIVRAFHAGLELVGPKPDVVVKLDADVSFADDYFERLLMAFAADPRLGIASGTCYESDGRGWQPTYVTGTRVRGASRAYRWSCLEQLLPLEERMGWDGLDELKANVLGWKTGIVDDLPFFHHRSVGARDGSPSTRWRSEGQGAHYMGYRFSYLVLRALYKARREPAALAMISGYLRAALGRRPRYADAAVVAHLRREQRLRHLARRRREAAGSR